MPNKHDSIQDDVTKVFNDVSSRLKLRYGGPQGMQDLMHRVDRSTAKPLASKTRMMIIAPIIGGVLLGGAALANEIYGDPTDGIFSNLHPEKENTSSAVEPHVLVGTVPVDGASAVRLYATTAAGANGSCVSAQRVDASGRVANSVNFCREVSVADLQSVNGAFVGYVPDDNVTRVQIAKSSGAIEAIVVHRFYLLSPDKVEPGESVSLSQYDVRGQLVRKTSIRVNE
jgi:hypothetical protein